MNFEKEPVRVYRVTLKKLIENLSKIKDCPLEDFKEEIMEAFEGYDYNDIEELVGFDSWPDISENNNYELMVKIDHKNAYEFTLYVTVKDQKATIDNVL